MARTTKRAEAPEFAALPAASKRLVRKLGMIPEQQITSETGVIGPGWIALENEGWVRSRSLTSDDLGYVIGFTLAGWEYWARQCDAEDGVELTPLMYGAHDTGSDADTAEDYRELDLPDAVDDARRAVRGEKA